MIKMAQELHVWCQANNIPEPKVELIFGDDWDRYRFHTALRHEIDTQTGLGPKDNFWHFSIFGIQFKTEVKK